jgi:Na+-translocating ferredoxin:NAD+ oxidoreductase RnfC subunit
MENRKAPMARLMQKMRLREYRNVGPLVEKLLETRRVGIALKQHVGAPCQAIVSVGQRVTKGQVVGRPPVTDGKPALGAPVHASLDGTVTAIADGVVWIER